MALNGEVTMARIVILGGSFGGLTSAFELNWYWWS